MTTIHRLYRKQLLPLSLKEAWSFFENPHNLGELTPKWLNFQMEPETPTTIHPGVILQYRIKIPPGIPIHWTTEISQVVPLRLFVDEQRFGPYKFWHHQHLFTETPQGVEMEDVVHYALGWGPLGSLAHAIYVKGSLKRIFDFRYLHLEEYFKNAAANQGTT